MKMMCFSVVRVQDVQDASEILDLELSDTVQITISALDSW